MKAKIAQALKTSYVNMGLSEEALNGVASLLEKTVTEESQIATAIGGDEVKALLKVFQSSNDSHRTAMQKLTKDFEDYKTAHPETKPKGEEHEEESELEKRLKALEERAIAAEKRASESQMRTSIQAKLEKECKDAPILKQVLKNFSLLENETEDAAVTRLTTEYNATVKEIRGDGYVPPFGNGGGSVDEAAFKDRLKSFAKNKGLVKESE